VGMGRYSLDHTTGTNVAKTGEIDTFAEGGVLLQARRHEIYVRIRMDQSAMANNGCRFTTRVRRFSAGSDE
jgi:hypothetical protein